MRKPPQWRFQCAPLPLPEYVALKSIKRDLLPDTTYRDVLAILTRSTVNLLKEEGGYKRLLAVRDEYRSQPPSETEVLLPPELVAQLTGQTATST